MRTKEQLGYIVQSAYQSDSEVSGAYIQIQSSKYGPDYLESRINNFLRDIRNGFEEELVCQVRDSLIQNLLQVHMNMIAETNDHWSALGSQNTDFDSRERLIEAMRKVDAKMVNEKLE